MRESRSKAAKPPGSEAPEGGVPSIHDNEPAPGQESVHFRAPVANRPRRSASTAEVASEPPPLNRREVDDQRAPDAGDAELKRRLGELKLEGGFDRVVTTVYSIDSKAEYAELSTGLQLSMKASEASYGRLVDALDGSEERARRASVLLANAKVAVRAYEIDSDGIKSALRDAAVAALQQEKDAGQRSKQITEGDIASEIASRFTDEHRELQLNFERAKRMADVVENLTYRWQERAKDLRQMVAKARDL